MSIKIERSHAYIFLGGLYIGNWTNIFSNVVITGLVLYITTPEIFTPDRWNRIKSWAWGYVKPGSNIDNKLENQNIKSIEHSYLSFRNLIPLPKIEILSPKQVVE